MVELMPYVNKRWSKKLVQQNQLLSDKKATTAANEAILLWFIEVYEEEWINEHEEDKAWRANHPLMKKPARKKEGKTKSIEKAARFGAIMSDTASARMDETRGKSWDLALQDRILEQQVSKRAGETGAEEQPAKKRSLIEYVDIPENYFEV
jgi:hypothetical protein